MCRRKEARRLCDDVLDRPGVNENFSLLSARGDSGNLGDRDPALERYDRKTRMEADTTTSAFLQSGITALSKERRCMNLTCSRWSFHSNGDP